MNWNETTTESFFIVLKTCLLSVQFTISFFFYAAMMAWLRQKTLSSHCCARVTQSYNPQSPRWNGAREWSTSIKVSHDTLGSVKREFTASSLTSSQEVDDDDSAMLCGVLWRKFAVNERNRRRLSARISILLFILRFFYFISSKTEQQKNVWA